MSLDTEWRRLARASRARRALKQWSIAHPALRGLADLTRGASVRVSAHVFNTADDVDRRLRGAPLVPRVRG
jgi:selenocysteine lyase/cysteine desulfurase